MPMSERTMILIPYLLGAFLSSIVSFLNELFKERSDDALPVLRILRFLLTLLALLEAGAFLGPEPLVVVAPWFLGGLGGGWVTWVE